MELHPTAASTDIYYSNGYDLEKRLQSEDRAHRIGLAEAGNIRGSHSSQNCR